MSKKIKFPKGSEWLKWDLHCHTPDDKSWVDKPSNEQEKENFIGDFIKTAKEVELKVIAITNHYEYNSIKDSYYQEIRDAGIKEDITILPGVEITADEGSGIHILSIFSETVELDVIDTLMTKIYPVKGKQVKTKEGVPICECGIQEIHDEFNKALDDNFILIFAHVNSKNGVISNKTITGAARVQAWKYPFMRFSQWTKNPLSYRENTFQGRIVRREDPNYQREHDMIHIVASDCRTLHCTSKVEATALGEKFTWIKSNPSFEGLLQVFYDPEGKVAFQENDPRKKNKQFFQAIQLGENQLFQKGKVHFFKSFLPLNPDMAAIIGSRGSGKSLLIDTFAKLHGKISKYNENLNKMELDQDFLITYQKEPNDIIESNISQINELDYIHVHQSEFKHICLNPIELDREIRKLLGISEFEYSVEFDEKIDDLVNNFFDIRNWLEEEDENGEYKHSKIYNEKRINKFEKKIGFIRTSESQMQIENFRKYQRNKLKFNVKLSKALELKKEFKKVQEKLNIIIVELNGSTPKKLHIPLVDFKDQEKKVKEIKPFFEEKIEDIEDRIEKIKDHFQEIEVEDVEYIMDQVSIYENAINKHQEILQKVDINKKKQKDIFPELSHIVDEILKLIEDYKKTINEKWRNLKEKEFKSMEQREIYSELLEGIEISSEIYFDEDAFYSLIKEYLNKNKFRKRGEVNRRQRLRNTFKVRDFKSFLSLIRNEKIISIEGKNVNLYEFLKISDYFNSEMDREFFKALYKSSSLKKFCKVISKTRLNGREVESLSMGERGTLFLRIKLATAAFSLPFIFDQPEDDLDNDFIQNYLVPLFSKLKKFRQIIVVTHNANIVVNSNAEQIIIANNENECIKYISGGLEEPTIRDEICNILEGGEEAFQKRAKKYGLANFS